MALHPHRYLDLLQSDARRMIALAPRHLDDAVPPCPGWDVAEVVRHTASVYGSKVATIRLGRPPHQGEWRIAPPDGVALVDWFGTTLTTLMEEFADHDPEEWASTWWPPDQTIGFWYRRMALETVVHRVDVESAARDVTVVEDDLATDGIDEVLTVFLGVRDAGSGGERDGTLSVAAGGRVWTVHLAEYEVRVQPGETGTATAELRGEAARVFLYLWGRGTLDGLETRGDLDLVTQLRRRLAVATQ